VLLGIGEIPYISLYKIIPIFQNNTALFLVGKAENYYGLIY
jgi:hypothetical protein